MVKLVWYNDLGGLLAHDIDTVIECLSLCSICSKLLIFVVEHSCAYHGDGDEDTKMRSNTDPLAPTRPLYNPSESTARQGALKRLLISIGYRSLQF